MSKFHYHTALEIPAINKIIYHKKYPEIGFLFWYAHLLKGIPMKPYAKYWADPYNMPLEVAKELGVTDFIWSLYPAYKDHVWDGTPDPLFAMVKAVTHNKWCAVSAATSVGKTYVASILVSYMLHTRKGIFINAVGASYEPLKDTFGKEMDKRWANEDLPRYGLHKLLPFAHNGNSGRIICERNKGGKDEGWMLKLRGVANPGQKKSSGSLQGIHGDDLLFLVDECATVPNGVLNAIINTCTGARNLILALGNPDSTVDALAQLSKMPKVVAIRVSALDHPNLVMPRPYDEPQVVGHGAVTKFSVEDRQPDPNIPFLEETDPFFQSRVRGIAPKNSAASMLKRDLFEAAIGTKSDYEDQKLPEEGIFVGIDVANSEKGDKANVTIIRDREVVFMKSFTCTNANAIAPNLLFSGKALNEVLNYTRDPLTGTLKKRDIPLPNYQLPNLAEMGVVAEDVAVDSVGMGEGTVNAFLEYGWEVYKFYGNTGTTEENIRQLHKLDRNGDPVLITKNIRTLAFYLTLWDFQDHNLFFHPDFANAPEHSATAKLLDSLYQQLAVHKVNAASAGGVSLIAKRQMMKDILGGGSPNEADGFNMANFIRHYRLSTFAFGVYY